MRYARALSNNVIEDYWRRLLPRMFLVAPIFAFIFENRRFIELSSEFCHWITPSLNVRAV